MHREHEVLDLEVISREVNSMFSGLPYEVPELLLLHGGYSPDAISELESALGCHLPDDFKRTIETYRLSGFSLGPIDFSSGVDYLRSIYENNRSSDEPRWWGSGDRPEELLLIAVSDRFPLLISTVNSDIITYDMDSARDRSLIRVASCFSMLMRGAGTMVVRRGDGDVSVSFTLNILKATGGEPASEIFWRTIA